MLLAAGAAVNAASKVCSESLAGLICMCTFGSLSLSLSLSLSSLVERMLMMLGSNSPMMCGVGTGALQDGWTALMHAAQNGHDAVVKMLLERNATIDQADTVGFVKCEPGFHSEQH